MVQTQGDTRPPAYAYRVPADSPAGFAVVQARACAVPGGNGALVYWQYFVVRTPAAPVLLPQTHTIAPTTQVHALTSVATSPSLSFARAP